MMSSLFQLLFVGVVQCYIRRNKNGTNKLFPVYSLYLKEGDRFLMASRKRPNNKTSNYLISMGEGDLSRDGSNYLGKLRSNFVGTEFQIFDNGSNPKESEQDEPSSYGGGAIRRDLGAVMYAANVLGSRGPRKMQVAIPSVDESGVAAVVRNRATPDGEDILTRMRDRSLRDLAYLINKPPRWNEQVGAYVLNFNGRVTMASVKNFQLVDPDEQNAVVLQFGRVAKDEFTMDMQWPITPFQAFAVTLSSFDSKIACD
jgi:tubby-related protein 1